MKVNQFLETHSNYIHLLLTLSCNIRWFFFLRGMYESANSNFLKRIEFSAFTHLNRSALSFRSNNINHFHFTSYPSKTPRLLSVHVVIISSCQTRDENQERDLYDLKKNSLKEAYR